jgi:sortase A
METTARSRPGTRARLGVLLLAAGVPVLLSSCGSSGSDAEAATVTTAATTTSPTTTAPPPTTTTTTPPTTTTTTTSTTTTTTSTTTTTTTTTTTAPPPPPPPQPPAPIAPPADAYGAEPLVEIGWILIPKIGVSSPMLEGIRMTTLDIGPGHWPGTALPGQGGNVVVAGHRTSKNKVFRNIDQLVPGDEIIFGMSDGEHRYRVTRTEIVNPDAVWIVNPTPSPTATLFACHPPGSTRQRIVVFADLIT